MSLARQAMRSVLLNVASSYGQQAMGFFSTLVLARLLTPDDFGKYGLGLTIYMFFARVRTFGFGRVFFSIPEADDQDLSTLLWLSGATSLLVIVVVALATPLTQWLYGDEIARILLFISLIALFESEGLSATAEAQLRRDLAYSRIAVVNLTATGLSLLVTILLALQEWGVWALVVGYAIKTLMYFAGTWTFAPRFKLLMLDRDRVRYFFRHGRNMWLGGLGGFLAFLYDDLAVGTFTNTGTLGNYRKAYDLALVPLAFISGAAEVMEPTYARSRDNRAGLTLAVTGILDVVTKLVFPMGAVLAIAAPEIIPLYLGPQWSAAIPMLQALSIYAAFRPAIDVTGSLGNVTGRTDVVRNYGLAMSIVMLVGCTALTLWIGAVGAALSAGLAVIVGFAIIYRGILRHYTDIRFGEVFVPPLLAVLAGAAVVVLVAGRFQPGTPLLNLLFKVGLFGVVYLLVLAVLQGRQLLQKARQMLDLLRGRTDAEDDEPSE